MSYMRRKGRGTWDSQQERWELKKEKLYKKPKHLSEYFGVQVPEGKIASQPFWERFLDEYFAAKAEKRKLICPVPLRLWSVERLILLR